MAHAHDQFNRTQPRAGVENFIDQRDECGDSFEREALAAEIPLLHYLLEDVSADEEIEDSLLIFLGRLRFHAVEDPTPPLGSVKVVDLYADGARVDVTGLVGVLALSFKFGSGAWTQESEGIEVTFEISELAVSAEHSFALGIMAREFRTICGRRFGSGSAGDLCFRHKNVIPRIKDAGLWRGIPDEKAL